MTVQHASKMHPAIRTAGGTVVVVNQEPDEPVYHSRGPSGRTTCACWIGTGISGAVLELTHAAKFCRPCRLCFPEVFEVES